MRLPVSRSDLRSALRALRVSPAYMTAAVLTLALGVAAVTAVFAVVNGLYLRPLPYADGARLIVLHEAEPDGDPEWTVSPADFAAWRSATRTLASVAAYNLWYPIVSDDDASDRVAAAIATPDFFRTLGVAPALGAGFDPAWTGDERVVVLSHPYWRTRFGANPAAIGGTLRLNGQPHTVVGVMPPDFQHPNPRNTAAFWVPFQIDESERARFLYVIARLAPSATPATVTAELSALAAAIAREHPETNAGWGITVHALRDELFGERRATTLLLLAAAALVLLIACVNVATLTLARNARRRHEFAVRAALGAGTGRLFGQVMVEAALLAAAGAALGVVLVGLAGAAVAHLAALLLSPIPRFGLDARVLAFVIATCALVTLVFGAMPAARAARTPALPALRESGRGAVGGLRGARTRVLPIAAEIALATTLLVCLALIGRSYVRLTAVPTGFDAERVLTAEVVAPSWRYPSEEEVAAFYDRLLERLRSLPAVDAAALISDLPFTTENRFQYILPADAPPGREPPLVETQVVSPDFFRTVGIPLLAGRDFDVRDRGGAPLVVIANRAFADRFFAGRDVVGEQIRLGEGDETGILEIVGLVGDVLDDGFASVAEPRIYGPWAQWAGRGMAVVLRTAGDPTGLASPLRQAVREIDAAVPVGEVRPLASILDATVAPRRGGLTLVAVFGLLAVALVGVGVYGVISYGVSSRSRELGVRVALGAGPGRLLRTVLAEALAAGAAGLAAGAVLAIAAAHAIRGTLFGVAPADPLSFLATGAAIAIVTLAAAWRPARRAARTPSAEALRQD